MDQDFDQCLSSKLLSEAERSRIYARLAAAGLFTAFILNFVLPPIIATAELMSHFHYGELGALAGIVNLDPELRYGGERDMSNALTGLLFQGVVTLLLIGSGIYQYIRMRVALRRATKGGAFIAIKEHEVPDLSAVVRNLASKMSVTLGQLSLFWIDSERISPSVLERNGNISLFIPSGFLVLSASQPLAASAILAHEFGHILVGDTRLWLFSVSAQTTFGRLGWRAVVPVALTTLVLPGLWASRLGLIIILWSIGLSVMVCHSSILFLFWARRKSEQIADAIAAHFVGKRAFEDAVQLVSAEGSISHIHLSKGERLAFIKGL
jgi:hypothetical protein